MSDPLDCVQLRSGAFQTFPYLRARKLQSRAYATSAP
jgi:hypothetical protein